MPSMQSNARCGSYKLAHAIEPLTDVTLSHKILLSFKEWRGGNAGQALRELACYELESF